MGGSTTFGRPYANTTSFCGWLQELLPQVDAANRWQVLNAGGVSYASYRITRVMEELAQYQPDLFIVYTGQNEFLERRTYANLFDQSEVQLATTSLLSRTRIWSLLRTAANRESQSTSDAPGDNVPSNIGLSNIGPSDILPAEVNERLNYTVGPADYHRDDQWRAKVLQHFQLNLKRMAQIARDAGAQIVFVVPASNEKDCSPFKSEADASGQRHAGDRFDRGQELFEAGEWRSARTMFQEAIDQDICPLRAPSDFVAAIRQAAKANDATLVDFDQLLRDQCERENGHRMLGDEFFLDHVHPTIQAHLDLAVWIIEALQRQQQIDGQALSADAIANTHTQVLGELDPTQRAIALRNLAKVLHWSGKFEEAAPRARDALSFLKDDPESLLVLADCLWQTGQTDEAIERYERLSWTSPTYLRMYQPFGEALLELERFAEAREYLSLASMLLPEGDRQIRSTFKLAIAHVKLHEFDQAEPLLEWMHKRYPEDRDTLFYLAQTKAGLGESEQALALYDKSLEFVPADVEILNCVGMLQLQSGKAAAALKYFDEAVRIAPDDEKSRSSREIAREIHRQALK